MVCTEYGVVNLFNLIAGVPLPRVWDTVCLHVYMCLSFLSPPCEVCPRYVRRDRLFNGKRMTCLCLTKLHSVWLRRGSQ